MGEVVDQSGIRIATAANAILDAKLGQEHFVPGVLDVSCSNSVVGVPGRHGKLSEAISQGVVTTRTGSRTYTRTDIPTHTHTNSLIH